MNSKTKKIINGLGWVILFTGCVVFASLYMHNLYDKHKIDTYRDALTASLEATPTPIPVAEDNFSTPYCKCHADFQTRPFEGENISLVQSYIRFYFEMDTDNNIRKVNVENYDAINLPICTNIILTTYNCGAFSVYPDPLGIPPDVYDDWYSDLPNIDFD